MNTYHFFVIALKNYIGVTVGEAGTKIAQFDSDESAINNLKSIKDSRTSIEYAEIHKCTDNKMELIYSEGYSGDTLYGILCGPEILPKNGYNAIAVFQDPIEFNG